MPLICARRCYAAMASECPSRHQRMPDAPCRPREDRVNRWIENRGDEDEICRTPRSGGRRWLTQVTPARATIRNASAHTSCQRAPLAPIHRPPCQAARWQRRASCEGTLPADFRCVISSHITIIPLVTSIPSMLLPPSRPIPQCRILLRGGSSFR